MLSSLEPSPMEWGRLSLAARIALVAGMVAGITLITWMYLTLQSAF